MFRNLLLLSATVTAVIIDESKIKEFKWRGPPVIDETIFTNPNSFDYDFNDDLSKPADMTDIYDQNVDQLPNFDVWKIGRNLGVTKLPIVTRRWPSWSTQANTRGPLDFFGTPSTPVSPVFVSSEHPMTTTPMTTRAMMPTLVTEASTTTTVAATTTRAPGTTETTTVPSTFATRTRFTFARERASTTTPFSLPTTIEATTVRPTTTAPQQIFNRGRVVQQPPPAFKTGHGPIWRKGGRIEFVDATSAPSATPTVQHRNTFISFTRRPLVLVPGFIRNFGHQRNSVTNRAQTLETTTTRTVQSFPVVSTTVHTPFHSASRSPQSHVFHTARDFQTLPKPVVIHHGPTRYRGPTYNCRVMNPFEDGVASLEHDQNCKMLYPGMSLDGQCRCFYKVSGRDEHGCAIGFLYACKPLSLHSVVVR